MILEYIQISEKTCYHNILRSYNLILWSRMYLDFVFLDIGRKVYGSEIASRAFQDGTTVLCGLWLLSTTITSSFSRPMRPLLLLALILFDVLLLGDMLLFSRLLWGFVHRIV